MANNIKALQEEFIKRDKENAELAAQTFDPNDMELTDEEKKKVEELQGKTEVVVTMQDGGVTTSVPMEQYMADVDKEIKPIESPKTGFIAKGVHTGDIVHTAVQLKEDARKKALQAFRDISGKGGEELTDDEILSINDATIAAIQEYLRSKGISSDGKLDANVIIKQFRRLSMRQISKVLPKEFMDIHVSQSELVAESYAAKERLLATLGYLTVTGPELDYLNSYIDHENKLMMLTHRMIECQANIAKALTSQETLVEMTKKVSALNPVSPDSVWSKYIKGGPSKLHNEFAQKAVVTQMMGDVYRDLVHEYSDDLDCIQQLQEQIDESDAKYQMYRHITDLELMKDLWETLTTRLKADKRASYNNLMREALAAMERIRRSKQNVSFPIYAEGTPGNSKSEVLLKMYMDQYPPLLGVCNESVKEVRAKSETELTGEDDIRPLEIEGIPNQQVHEMMALLLLILYGRIMKALTPHDQTKYQALELDAYFTIYCKLITDVYLLNRIWLLMRDFVEYAIKAWPASKKHKR